jgi:hypothetical protein
LISTLASRHVAHIFTFPVTPVDPLVPILPNATAPPLPFRLSLEGTYRTPPLFRFPSQLPSSALLLAVGSYISPLTASKTFARTITGSDIFGTVRAESNWVFATPTGLGTVAGSLFVAHPDSVARVLLRSICMFNRSSNCNHLLAVKPNGCDRASNISDLINLDVKPSRGCVLKLQAASRARAILRRNLLLAHLLPHYCSSLSLFPSLL